ncbi:unnamed protein product [Peronospora belbahrii]|uniref:CST complex subunit CTC1 n=1 Tax=Peronospora belbahrii TaxID=622444 RepID=A0ABN8CWW6_9STRA|nr:unnamed protein product [Peronospora belbahrii]
MDLLDAIEQFEQQTDACQTTRREFDFVERQVLFVQQKVRESWQRKRGSSVELPCIPFYWVFSKLLRLIEEYPDGLTEAIVLTEVNIFLNQKEEANDTNYKVTKVYKKRKYHDLSETEEFLADNIQQQKGFTATIINYENHQFVLEMKKVPHVTVHMYLHQRFRSCMDFWHDTLQDESNGGDTAFFPFQIDGEVVFTNAKLLERKEIDMKQSMVNGEKNRAKFTFLPTAFLIPRLNEEKVLDHKLVADAISLSQVDRLVGEIQDTSAIQVLTIKVQVLDIGAVRPCQTPLYVHRQVILLGEVEQTNTSATTNSQQLTQGLHLMVLWDDQVALSRLFRVGDTLTIFHPFVHVCGQHDTEILHILNEHSFQQRISYYFEYGSATVLFSKSSRVSTMDNSPTTLANPQEHSEMEQPLSHLDDIKPGWHNFSLYAHVRSITVSHGIPLLAAFFYAYYDSKTNQPGTMNTKMLPPPPLDCTIVSRYYLVVMLQVYIASSERLLTIEVTGENALTALRLLPGQSVFFDGLVAIDIQSKSVRRYRERGCMPLASASTTKAEFALPTKAYSTSPSSSVVVLCSDWESIFGKQSLFHNSSKLTVINTTPGLLNTVLDRSTTLDNVAAHALTMTEMTLSGAGWLIPIDTLGAQSFTMDPTCEKGHATTYAHKACFRPLELMTRKGEQVPNPPKWKCLFCHEILCGLQDTVQTYNELAVMLQNGRSRTCPLVVLCQGETVETLLGLSADRYVQLPFTQKRKRLECVMGTSFQLVLSRCAPRHVFIPSTSFSPLVRHDTDDTRTLVIHSRMDLVQSIDPFARAHDILSRLKS